VSRLRAALAVAVAVGAGGLLAACGGGSPAAVSGSGVVNAVGAENQYADVISQIGGRYVAVSAIESDPNTDPHTFEASASVARELADARLVVLNGLGYDSWAQKILAASPSSGRKEIVAQTLLGLPDSTPNPHLWYDPSTMPAVAKAIAGDLSTLDPSHAATFRANLSAFDASLQPWFQAIAAFKVTSGGTPVAVTEPVADYLLQALGADIRTPFSLQSAIMNGTDPSPEDVATQQTLFKDHRVKVFVYNQQVTDSLTQSFVSLAKSEGIPVVGVYETMPTPGYTYQTWMLAETEAITKAVEHRVSTTHL
jgi:zinc/manganese transport system substrate-binding protein